MRDYTAVPFEYLDEMDGLSDEEYGRLIRALQKYSAMGEEPELPGAERLFWKRVRNREDRYQEGYAQLAQSRAEAGRKGAEKRWQTMANDSKAIANDGKAIANDGKAIFANGKNGNTETKTNTNTNTKTKNISPDGENTRVKRFTPPTLAEVQSYVAERQSPVDPQGFIDFYESKGWLVGKTPMKDWKAACRNAEKWERWTRPDVQKAKGAVTQTSVNSQEYRDSLRRDMAWLEQFSRGEVEV